MTNAIFRSQPIVSLYSQDRMMLALRGFLLALGLVSFSAIADATEWFDFDRETALNRMRAAVERLDEIAPIPALTCRPNAGAIRFCSVDITTGLRLHISTTLGIVSERATRDDWRRFRENDTEGSVEAIRLVLSHPGERSRVASQMFETLCQAAMLTVRPSLRPRDAKERFSALVRGAINRSAIHEGARWVGRPETVFVSGTLGGAFECIIDASNALRS